MYNYTAGATGLDAAMPPWVQEGGLNEWIKRLKNPEIRKKVTIEKQSKRENLCLAAGAEKTILIGFKSDPLKKIHRQNIAGSFRNKKSTLV